MLRFGFHKKRFIFRIDIINLVIVIDISPVRNNDALLRGGSLNKLQNKRIYLSRYVRTLNSDLFTIVTSLHWYIVKDMSEKIEGRH